MLLANHMKCFSRSPALTTDSDPQEEKRVVMFAIPAAIAAAGPMLIAALGALGLGSVASTLS